MQSLARTIATLIGFVAVTSAGAATAAPELPVVVLIGDSIRLGYAPLVAEQLKGVARVVSVEENGGDSGNVLKHLDDWAIRPKPVVIHFNAGLHDLRTDPKTNAHQVALDAYRNNLRAIVERLESETTARLIFATTTPLVEPRIGAAKSFLRRGADVRAYNESALAVMRASAVSVDDLYGLTTRLGPESVMEFDGVHFTRDGYQALATQVASEVKKALREPAATRVAVCRRADSAPTIDGRLDDPAWTRAEVIDRFPAFWNNVESGQGTRARLLWNDEALFFSAAMTDAELRAFGRHRNDRLWEGDVFELFFKPDAERPEYYEFQVNPRGTILELPFPRRGADFATLAAGPPLGMVAAVSTDGTLDQPGDRDRGWSVEGRIPWSAVAPSGGRPQVGSAWSFALCRYDYGPNGTIPTLVSSAPLSRPSFHRFEDYGRLRFEGPRP